MVRPAVTFATIHWSRSEGRVETSDGGADDLVACARIVAGAGEEVSAEDVNRAMTALRDVIQHLARNVVHGVRGRTRALLDDFVEGAPSVVFEELRKGSFDPNRGSDPRSLKAWLASLL